MSDKKNYFYFFKKNLYVIKFCHAKIFFITHRANSNNNFWGTFKILVRPFCGLCTEYTRRSTLRSRRNPLKFLLGSIFSFLLSQQSKKRCEKSVRSLISRRVSLLTRSVTWRLTCFSYHVVVLGTSLSRGVFHFRIPCIGRIIIVSLWSII